MDDMFIKLSCCELRQTANSHQVNLKNNFHAPFIHESAKLLLWLDKKSWSWISNDDNVSSGITTRFDTVAYCTVDKY